MAVMTNPAAIKAFLGAGKATVTLQSQATDNHYTYRVIKKDDVSLVLILTGGDQEFTYLGMIGNRGFTLTPKSRLNNGSVPVKAFRYFYDNVIGAGRLPSQLTVRHEGKCGRCGRPLTHPDSIDSGIGPECAKHLH